jgi:dihydroorotase
MSGDLTVRQARLVLPDRVATGDIVIENGVIAEIGPRLGRAVGEEIDGAGLVVLPGGIDPQVHFREPGFPQKEDIGSGSRACAAGGITSFLEMPNTSPPTTTVARLEEKLGLAASKSVVHYGFFIGATRDNLDELVAAERTPGIKIFMGSSTGTLLVNEREDLDRIFAAANKPIAVHAEDEERLRARKAAFADSTDPADHPKIRDAEAALIATKLAIELALKHGKRLHILHVSSAEEAELLRTVPRERISAETCPQYLTLAAPDCYVRLGTKAQCNPPIRSQRHQDVLWKNLLEGTFDCIATDHAPHTLEEKAAGYPKSPSGMPGVEWTIPILLDQVNRGRVTLRQVAQWVCEGPARVYSIPRKGRLEVGYDGDIVICDPKLSKTVGDGPIFTRVGWSPYAGMSLTGWPVMTVVLGRPVFRDGKIVEDVRGEELTYDR